MKPWALQAEWPLWMPRMHVTVVQASVIPAFLTVRPQFVFDSNAVTFYKIEIFNKAAHCISHILKNLLVLLFKHQRFCGVMKNLIQITIEGG